MRELGRSLNSLLGSLRGWLHKRRVIRPEAGWYKADNQWDGLGEQYTRNTSHLGNILAVD